MPASLVRGSIFFALAALVAGVDNFVNVPISGLEPGWQFQAYDFDRSNNFAEISGTRKTGVVASPEFFVNGNSPPAVYGLGSSKDYIMIKWSGFLRIILSGTYKFELGSDDGSLLYVDGLLVSAIQDLNSPAQPLQCVSVAHMYVMRVEQD
jgi:hypothetical protein